MAGRRIGQYLTNTSNSTLNRRETGYPGFRIITWAILLSTTTCLAMLLIGTSDSEFSNRADQNWGASYLLKEPTWSLGNPGIRRVFGVPVFDGAQGFGYRLPNFVTTQHMSPLILLSRWLPSFFLSISLVWMALVVFTVALVRTLRSWHGQVSVLPTLFTGSVAMSPVVVYLLYNDWALPLASIVSALTVITCLFHKSLTRPLLNNETFRGEKVTAALFLMAISVQLAGHPRYLMLMVPLFLVLSDRAFRLFVVILKSPSLLLSAVLIVASSAILGVEYRQLGLGSEAIRQIEPSALSTLIWSDEKDPNWHDAVKAFAQNLALPLLRLTMPDRLPLVHSRVEFLNFLILGTPLLIAASSRRLWKLPQELRKVLLVILVGLLWMVAGPIISRSVPVLRLLFLQDGWDLSYLVAFVGMLGASTLVSSNIQRQSVGTRKVPHFLNLARLIYLVGGIMAIAQPITLVLNAPTLNGDTPRRDWVQVHGRRNFSTSDFAGSTFSGRVGWTEQSDLKSSGCVSRNLWEAQTGLSHWIVLSREGLPTIESLPGFRTAGPTLRAVSDNAEELIYLCDTLLFAGCSIEVLDFLSFRAVSPLEISPDCISGAIRGLEAPDTNYPLESTSEKPDNDSALTYHNYFVGQNFSAAANTSVCSLFESCLSDAVRGATSTTEPPWTLCRADCWFTYRILDGTRPENSLLLLPVRYDEAMYVSVDKNPKLSPQVVSYRGMAALNVTGIQSSSMITVYLAADSRFLQTALVPYLMFVAILLCGSTIWRIHRTA